VLWYICNDYFDNRCQRGNVKSMCAQLTILFTLDGLAKNLLDTFRAILIIQQKDAFTFFFPFAILDHEESFHHLKIVVL